MVFSMDRWIGKIAIVTGASSGIGASIAENLVKQGLQVGALARRKDRLDDLAKKLSKEEGKLIPIKTDVTNEADIINAFKWIKENVGPVHILVNSAGVILEKTGILEGDTEEWKRLYNINVIALSIATREAIKDMRANNVDGHIIHINSVVGHQVANHPMLNIYASSKFAVTGLAETLRLELMNIKSKIKITSISPGLVNTELLDTGRFRDSSTFKQILEAKQLLDPQDVTDGVLYALSTPPHVQILETVTDTRKSKSEQNRPNLALPAAEFYKSLR